MINYTIIEQVLMEQILVHNDFSVLALILLNEEAGLKEVLVHRKVKTLNVLTVGRVVADHLDEMAHYYPVGDLDYIILSIMPYIIGVDDGSPKDKV